MTLPRSSTLSAAAHANDRRRSFGVVLAVEFWERFGFYGMQAILLLYLVQHLGVDERTGNLMLGAFSMILYVTPVLGGVLADRLLGTRRAVMLGACAMALGYGGLSLSASIPQCLFGSLAFIATGNGLFKPNAGNLVRAIFDHDDAGLDAAFTLYYMAVNVGATLSMLATPWLQDSWSASAAFGLCALGLAGGVAYAALRWRKLDLAANAADGLPVSRTMMGLIAAGFAGVVVLAALVVAVPSVTRACVVIVSLGLIGAWVWLMRVVAPGERPGLGLAYILCAQSALYFVFYQQMMTSLTLFALHAVDGAFRIGGWTAFRMSPAQFESLNSVWIVAASPLLAAGYGFLARRGRDVSLASKSAFGFVLVACAFLVWWQAAARAAAAHTDVSAWVMVIGYGLLSVGELFISGLALAVVSRYVPMRMSGAMMGALYLLWGVCMYGGSILANESARGQGVILADGAGPFVPLFHHLFVFGAAIALVVVMILPICRRLDAIARAGR